MDPSILLAVVAGYFGLLFIISLITGRNSDNRTFFSANRNSPWPLVAFGMIGTTLSGVTFISIPGAIGAGGLNQGFSYMQVTMGYMLGYATIALVLLPLYYRLKLTSIYAYLRQRFGFASHKTGSAFFLLSRIIGASFRLYLVGLVLDRFVLGPLGVSFETTVGITIILIWLYTFRGGIKTVVWTDTLQTATMLIAVILTVFALGSEMNLGLGGMIDTIKASDYSQWFFFEGGWSDPNNFFKQFLGGAFLTIVMTGLDQDMMQKNLTCRSLPDAKKNMFVFSGVLFVVKLMFVALGALLYIYAAHISMQIPMRSDALYPTLALEHLSPVIGVVFIIGLIAAAYSSADSALTALTTSFCVDILELDKKNLSSKRSFLFRSLVHVAFAITLFRVIIIFNGVNNDAVINSLFRAAGYTYGPLLGLYAFGLFSKLQVRDLWVPVICLASPIVCYILNANSKALLNGYTFGFELLILNGLLTFLGLWAISKRG
jgi:Na+/proline symporter